MLNINSITNLLKHKESAYYRDSYFYLPSHGLKWMWVAFIGSFNKSISGTGDTEGADHLYGISIRCGVSNAGSVVVTTSGSRGPDELLAGFCIAIS